MNYFFRTFLCFLPIVLFIDAQTVSKSSSGLLLDIKKLNVASSVLYIAAHPDDENTRLLTYLVKEKKVRTGYLSLTRGDGGQNLIGKEQGDALGLIRTQELLAARRTDGAEQFFTSAYDFGYSKNPEETFSIWNKEKILGDVVSVIRQFKPDIIICRFPTTGEGGHGHHTASAILAEEAFALAGDPTKYPEQLAFTTVWQPKYLFWNTFNFGGTNTTAENQLKIDVGLYNPLIGRSYGEIAAESRTNHKSQGFGSAPSRGSMIEYFKQLKGVPVTNSIFDGINTNLNRFPEFDSIASQLNTCAAAFDPESPERSTKKLVEIYTALKNTNSKDLLAKHYQKLKLDALRDIILTSCGVFLETVAETYATTPGSVLNVTTNIINRSNNMVKLDQLSYFSNNDTVVSLDLKNNELKTIKRKLQVPPNEPYSNPYWLNIPHPNSGFVINDLSLIGKPENTDNLSVTYDLDIEGVRFQMKKDIQYKSVDPVKGEIYRPLQVLPPATLNFSDKIVLFTSTNKKNIQLLIKSNEPDFKGELEFSTPAGWTVFVKNKSINIPEKGGELTLDLVVEGSANAKNGNLIATIKTDNDKLTKSIYSIDYDHIPSQFILSEASAKLIRLNTKIENLNIGYIEGAGDDVAACLKQVGYTITMLTEEMLLNSDLQQFNTIITGVRAYNTNDRLQAHYAKLMEYVKQGGNLIVQYNTNNRIGPVGTKIGPYPFTISRNRVTDENASVSFVDPNHAVLNKPNKITSSDFNDWIQERGIYFASDIDSTYEKIFLMADKNEKADDGSLIIAKYGKGNFVYTGLAFFRQLPSGIPGAYNLFANIIALPKNN